MGGYPCGGAGEPCDAEGTPYYRPGDTVSRGQIAKIAALAGGFSDDPGAPIYADVPSDAPFYRWINQLSRLHYMGGYSCGGPGEPCDAESRPYFRPNASATRGQITKIVANAAGFGEPVAGQTFEDVPPGSPYYLYVERLAARNVMGGYPCGGAGEACVPPENRPYFRPASLVTRGQAAKITGYAFFPQCSP